MEGPGQRQQEPIGGGGGCASVGGVGSGLSPWGGQLSGTERVWCRSDRVADTDQGERGWCL